MMTKKFLTLSLICLLFAGILAPQLTFASNLTPAQAVEAEVKYNKAVEDLKANPNDPVLQKAVADAKAFLDANTGPATGQTKNPSWYTDIALGVVAWLAYLVLTLMSWLLWLSGMLLNIVLDQTIINFAGNLSKMTGINTAWKVIRDVVNMAFIFLLLYNAILVIVSKKTTDQIKSIVVGIVVTALLINFSMFVTKVIIDASNIATIGFYKSIVNAGQTSTLETAAGISTVPNGISGAFANALHITSFFSKDAVIKPDNTSMIIIYLGGSILFFVVAFVLFAISMMFIIRYVAFLLLLMFSPLAFAGIGLPQLKGAQDTWWETLKGQAIFAPLYMFLTWVILTLIGSEGFIPSVAKLSDINNTTDKTAQMGAIALIINFAVIIALIIFSLTKSKEWAGKGSTYIKEYTGKLTTFAGGVAMGGAAWGMRSSIGNIGKRVADNAGLQEAAATKTGFTGAGARLALYASKKARSGSFDVRSATIPTNAAGDLIEGTLGRTGVGKALGLNDVNIPSIAIGAMAAGQIGAGKGGEKGYKESKEESAKRVRDREAVAASELALAVAKKDVRDGAGADPSTATGRDAIEKMEKALAKLSAKETEALVASNRELLASQNFANKISVQQLEALNKSDQFSEAEKGKLKNARFSGINDGMAALSVPVATRTPAQNAAIAALSGKVKGLSDSEIEMLDPSYFDITDPKSQEFVSLLRSGQAEAIGKSNKFTSTQKDTVKTLRKKPLIDAMAAGNSAVAQSELKKMNAKDIVALGIGTMSNSLLLQGYTPNLLKKMAVEMNTADIATLRTALEAPAPGGGTVATQAWLAHPDKGMVEFV